MLSVGGSPLDAFISQLYGHPLASGESAKTQRHLISYPPEWNSQRPFEKGASKSIFWIRRTLRKYDHNVENAT